MADISGLYTVATNDNVTSTDHNSNVTAIQNVNAETELAVVLALQAGG